MKYLIWDFDGTLAYRQGGMWSAAILELLDRAAPGHALTAERLRPMLQSGFPWQTPERPHTDIISADQWWQALEPEFERLFVALGLAPEQAQALSTRVRTNYCNLQRWRLFDDSLEALDSLSARGWTHLILTNHVPELRLIVDHLGLKARIAAIFNSAETGYEKPHPQAFQQILSSIEPGTSVWMIGDNYTADILGAEQVSIPGVLVRQHHPQARIFCSGLEEIVEYFAHAHK